jgi:hypothetical protein
MEHVLQLGKMGSDCVATEQLPLSRVCHCVTAALATLSSHPATAQLIISCPDDVALTTLLMLAEVRRVMMWCDVMRKCADSLERWLHISLTSV